MTTGELSSTADEILILNFLAEAKTPRAVPSDRILPRALRAIRAHLDMDGAFIAEARRGQHALRYTDALGAHGAQLLQARLSEGVFSGRLPEMLTDTSTDPKAASLLVTDTNRIGGYICVPIRLLDGTIFGMLGCYSREPARSLNERDKRLVRVFAELACEHIEADMADAAERVELTDRVRSVLSGESLSLVYQPIFDLRTGEVAGVESLARFTATPLRSPAAWFADAAVVGLDAELEAKVIEKAIESFASLPAGVYVTFNVSPNIVIHGHLMSAFASAPLERIVLEINEHVSFRNYDEMAKVLSPLRERGLRISVNDSGAGTSGFRHIVSLKPDMLKLHMSVTRAVDHDIATRAAAAAVIQFGRDQGCKVIAEGVETAAELKALRAMGVVHAQGYYLGRPLRLDDAAALCQLHGAHDTPELVAA